MAKTGLTLEQLRQIEEKHPKVKKATYPIPHMGYASMASNYALHLASL
jgi:hypothetical protein